LSYILLMKLVFAANSDFLFIFAIQCRRP